MISLSQLDTAIYYAVSQYFVSAGYSIDTAQNTTPAQQETAINALQGAYLEIISGGLTTVGNAADNAIHLIRYSNSPGTYALPVSWEQDGLGGEYRLDTVRQVERVVYEVRTVCADTAVSQVAENGLVNCLRTGTSLKIPNQTLTGYLDNPGYYLQVDSRTLINRKEKLEYMGRVAVLDVPLGTPTVGPDTTVYPSLQELRTRVYLEDNTGNPVDTLLND